MSSALQKIGAGRVVLALALGLFAVGCVPTISKQRGEAHLNALAEAEAHQHHGRLAEAAAAYRDAAEKAERRVDRDECLYRESRVYARMGEFQKAIELCDQLAEIEPMARRTLRAKLDASRYRLLGDDADEIKKAEKTLRNLITEHPDSAASRSALRMLAVRHIDDVEDKEEGLAWLESLLEEVRNESIGEPMMNIQAELLLKLGRRDEAIGILESQVEKYPYPEGRRWDDALYRLAELAVEDKNPKKAIAFLEQMIEVHESSYIIGSYTRPMFSKAALKIARIYRDELNDPKSAIKAYAHVRSEFPMSLSVDDALAEEAELRLAQGDRAAGCDLLREVIAKHDAGQARRRAQAKVGESCN